MTLFGIDRLLIDPDLRKPLEGKRVALLAHPASVTRDLTHSLDALVASGLNVSAVFGPQHGVRGDLQDNMMESPDFTDPTYGVPVFSLYGEVRRPTGQSMGTFDTILVDLQDLGCRIYTYVTTLLYVLEADNEDLLGRREASIDALRRALTIDQRPELYFQIGTLLVELGRMDEAVENYVMGTRIRRSSTLNIPSPEAERRVRLRLEELERARRK